jgi:hypothetical protein
MKDAADIARAVGAVRGDGRALTGAGTRLSRSIWLVLFAAGSAVLVTALALSPDPAGHGTHTQLGLPPCGFLLVTGLPCPGCGLTTSFAHMIRLQVAGAFGANPFGVLLFCVTVAGVGISAVGMTRSLPVVRTLDRLHFEKVMIVLGVAALLAWVSRMGGTVFG